MGSNTEERLEEFLNLADSFLTSNKLGLEISINDEVVQLVDNFLSMSPSDMYKLTSREANNIGIFLDQYCLYLSKALARLNNTINFCNYYILEQLSSTRNDPEFEFITKDMRPHVLSEQNSVVKKLMELRLVSESRIEGMRETVGFIKSIGFRLSKIGRD